MVVDNGYICGDSTDSSHHQCSDDNSTCQRLSCSSTKYRPYISDIIRAKLVDNYFTPGSLPTDMPLHRVINNSGIFCARAEACNSPCPQDCPFHYGNNNTAAVPNLHSTSRKTGMSQLSSGSAKSMEAEADGEILVFDLEL